MRIHPFLFVYFLSDSVDKTGYDVKHHTVAALGFAVMPQV